jgi:hypothetical protein
LACIPYLWLTPLLGQRDNRLSLAPEGSNRGRPQEPLKDIDNRDLVGYEKDRLAELDNASRTLLTVSTIFALLLGLGAWKSLDDQRKFAEKNLDLQRSQFKLEFDQALTEHKQKVHHALEDIRQLREEMRLDFPMFGRMNKNFTGMLVELRGACAGLEPTDEAYSKLSWKERQRILFFEKVVADSLLLDMRDYADQLSEIYRLLGVFYGSRYSDACIRGDPPVSDDLDRARFYFDRAIEINPDNYLAYSHAGHFTMYFRDRVLATESRNYFRLAAALNTAAQKPLLNLALLELHAFEDIGSCLSAVSEAFRRNEWELPGSAPKNHHCNYIRACALSKQTASIAHATEQFSLYEEVLSSLEEAAEHADSWICSAFTQEDYQNKPDKDVFFSSVAVHPETRIRQRFVQAAAKIEAVPSSQPPGPTVVAKSV